MTIFNLFKRKEKEKLEMIVEDKEDNTQIKAQEKMYKTILDYNQPESKESRKKYEEHCRKALEEGVSKTKKGDYIYKELEFSKKHHKLAEIIGEYLDSLQNKILSLDEKELGNIKVEIQNLRKDYKKQLRGSDWYSEESYILNRLFYQFPGVLEKKIEEKVLNIPSKKITAFWPCMYNGVLSYLTKELGDYNEKKFKELGKKVLRKMYDVYKIDTSRKRRNLGGAYPGSGVVLTTSEDCLMSMESLGKYYLGMDKEQVYKFLGTSYETIEKIEKDWQEGKRAKWEKETPISISIKVG
jgi:hypothetical protein